MGFDYKNFKKARAGKADKPEWAGLKWVKFGVATVCYLAFLYWVKSWWGLIVLPFIYDVYISKKIKWTWWKELESDLGRTLMSWVDAIVFALVAVYFVNNFFFQNYQIPSSSLEKTLMTGDFLLVSKMSYGPRIPQTPLTMPLTQHTMPLIGCKSYIEWPQWEYRRVKGFGKVEQGDIVVFNYPAGDTVAVSYNGDYYALCYQEGSIALTEQGYEVPMMKGLKTEEQQAVYDEINRIGKQIVAAKTNIYGSVTSRPADRRENYVKRCVGLPGQTLQIKDKIIYVDGKKQETPTFAQFNYKVYTRNNQILSDEMCDELNISDEDRDKILDRNRGIPLTHMAVEALRANKEFCDSVVEVIDNNFFNESDPMEYSIWGMVYPLNHQYGWTRDNYGPIWIPAKGQSIKLTLDNLAIYERPIRVYEKNSLEVKDGKIYINGKQTNEYTFKMDYYWMMGDNRHNSADSRYWGFVPEDHIVGKPLFIWLSLITDRNGQSHGVRWSRLFTWVDNIK
ncbi:MAG: signal peptidase I [Bacteroidaceae bacterium]|nr:signal peptidase I [Bacteroidaceae bacterium]